MHPACTQVFQRSPCGGCGADRPIPLLLNWARPSGVVRAHKIREGHSVMPSSPHQPVTSHDSRMGLSLPPIGTGHELPSSEAQLGAGATTLARRVRRKPQLALGLSWSFLGIAAG